jgi:hypothetical protein
MLHGPGIGGRQHARRLGGKERLAQAAFDVRQHTAVLGDSDHDARAVEAGQPGREAGEVRDRGIGEAHERLGVGAQHAQIGVGQGADRVLAADRGDDALDGGVGEGGHQILGPSLRIAGEPVGVAQGVGGRHDTDAEGALQLRHPGRVALWIHRRAAPRQADSGYRVTSAQHRRAQQRPRSVDSFFGHTTSFSAISPRPAPEKVLPHLS